MSNTSAPPYAELHCVTNFSFLRGASHPEELIVRAAELGYEALAVTDECSVAGLVRAHKAAQESNLKLLIGAELRLVDGPRLVLIAPHRHAYGQMCALISLGRSLAPKGRYRLTQADLDEAVPGCLAILLIEDSSADREAAWFADRFGDRGWLGVNQLLDGFDAERLERSARLARRTGLPRLACGDVHMHRRGRRALQDTLTAIRLRKPLPEIGRAVYSNGERHLRSRPTLARLYPPALLAETLRLAERCTFSLDELRYEYPEELVPDGYTPSAWLRHLTQAGAKRRWPAGVSEPVRRQLEHELALIAELRYEPYFLTVHDVVRYARERNILCQGRGSAANSAVCYCLGITEVDPARLSLLFERFISRERDEPPDIDVDFEHERREEVIQHVYRKYGRSRAALAATVITYRPRSALRDAGRALGLAEDQLERLAGAVQRWEGGSIIDEERLREAGFDPGSPLLRRVLRIARELLGFPRHLSQHVGGFVISQGPLAELVPTENAAMAGRTVIQWDKDDLESLGLLKVDCLALGMLTALHKSFDLLERHRGRRLTLASVPAEVPAVYEMISRADTVGVFQVESRAQMAMLPRLRPQNFYDLVIEISLVRPGPIQGDMVHPYLRRREGLEAVDYPSPEVERVLARTLGVPIFQEQVMQLAVVAAGFSPGEADRLRRSMAAWRRRGGLGHFRERLLRGMRERGYKKTFAERIFAQVQGFGEYGFPESHAASFALLVYVSAWLKHFEPAVFTCALLNSQPMGFYAPAQLVRDAREHGVEVRAVDVTRSERDCTLESAGERLALRLGLRLVKGLSAAGGERIVHARATRAFREVQDLARRARLSRGDLKALAGAGALASLAGHRREAWWQVLGVEHDLPVFEDVEMAEPRSILRAPPEAEDVVDDYNAMGLSLGRHPMALLRPQLERHRFRTAAALRETGNKRLVRAAGLVISRQCPSAANGIVFVTLEDETGTVNVVVWKRVADRFRRVMVGARLMGVIGTWERRGEVVHLIAGRLEDHTHLLGALRTTSRDFQ